VNILWNKGKGNLGVINTRTHTVHDYERFWYYSEKNRVLDPLAAVCDREFTRIWSVAKDSISTEIFFMTCKLDSPELKVWELCKKLELQVIICYEASMLCQKLYLGGSKSNIAVLCVIDLSEKMEVEHTKKFVSVNLACITNLKRIEGTELLLVSGLNTVVCLSYHFTQKQFLQIHIFNNIGEGDIDAAIYFSGFVLLICPTSGCILRSKIPTDIPQSKQNQVEFPNLTFSANKQQEKIERDRIIELTNKLNSEFLKANGTHTFFANILDTYIDNAPRVLIENEEKAKENFENATVFSFALKTVARRLQHDDSSNRMFVASSDGCQQYDLDNREFKSIRASILKCRNI
jgi:hypothetical protein